MYQNRASATDGHLRHLDSAAQLRKLDDENLAHELAQGHDDALAILYERYAPVILGIAKRVIGELSEAEDTVQQVFLELHRAANRLGCAKGSVRSWLQGRAFQRALNKRAHLDSRGFYTSRDLEEVESELSQGALGRCRLFPPELSRLVDELLGKVSDLQRRVIELYLYEGLRIQEIAARVNQTVDVVKHNFYNALKTMRSALEEHTGVRETTGVDDE